MRLIDADKLVKAIKNENPGLSISGAVEKFARTAQVNMQPTVQAIPIEWLKSISKNLADAYWNNVGNKLVLDMKDLPLVMEEIVRIWEKENGK